MNLMNTDNLIFRKTNTVKGRHISVTPENSAMKHLRYGRIILDNETPSTSLETGNQETGLVCLSGQGTVTVGDQKIELRRYDAVYIPRGAAVQVSTDSVVDFAEFSSDVEGDYPLQIVRYEDVQKNPRAQVLRRGTGQQARSQHPDREKCAGGPHRRGRDDLRAGKLDKLAPARARGDAGGDVCLLRYARPGIRCSVRLH
jgi:5-deoxy-D-glucuronate isomerase